MPRVTLQTIADRVGVSRMTVSNAFSRPDQLSPALRERIFAAAQDLGYVGPDPTARALAKGTTGAVGIVLTESLREAFSDLVATTFLGAIADGLAPTGLALTMLGSTGNGEIVPARDVAIDGALIYSCEATSPALQWLTRRRLPLVLVDQTPVDGITSVNVADRSGARSAAQHLVDLGHRRIGIVTAGPYGRTGIIDEPDDSLDGHTTAERQAGWTEALRAAGIAPLVVRIHGARLDDVRAAATQLLDRADRPTAILCFSDVIAYGVVRAAGDLGLDVPTDLSVVGFDDQALARQTQPPLTTVRQDVEEKGRIAAAALTEAIALARTGAPGEARHVLLPTELIVRDSTAPPPGH